MRGLELGPSFRKGAERTGRAALKMSHAAPGRARLNPIGREQVNASVKARRRFAASGPLEEVCARL